MRTTPNTHVSSYESRYYDDRLAPPGYRAAPSTPPFSCQGCAFEADDACRGDRPCTPAERADTRSVIFILLETPDET